MGLIKKQKKTNKKYNFKNKTKKIDEIFKKINIKPTNEIKKIFHSNNNNVTLLIQYIKNKSDPDIILSIPSYDKINKLYKTFNKDILYDIIINTYEYITMHYINKKYYLNTYEGYDYNKFLKKQTFSINNNIFIPLSNFNSNNIYNKKYPIYEMLYNNNLITHSNKTYVSLDLFGPFEIKDNVLTLYNDLQSAIYDLSHSNNKYISIYDYHSWGIDLNYNKIINETAANKNIDFSYKIKKINNLKDIGEINNYILSKNRYKYVDFYYIRNQNKYTINKCKYEYYYINYLMTYLNIIFKTLKNNGILVINISSFPNITPLVNLLYYISTFFKQTNYYNCRVKITEHNFIFTGFIRSKINDNVFINLNNIITEILDYFNEYNNLDFNFYNGKINCNEGNISENLLIYKLTVNVNNNLDFINFKKWINICFIEHYKRISIIYKYYTYIEKIPKYILKKNINYFLQTNLNYCIAYCNKYKISINKAYIDKDGNIENNIITHNNFIMKFFPYEKNIDFNRLKITRIGLYSISPRYMTDFLLDKININIPNINNYIITDANGGIGGDAIILTKICKFVNIVELDAKHSSIIKHNLKIYNRKNYKIYNSDYTDIYKILVQSIVYLDPPWGGSNYKEHKKINLYLSGININDIITYLIKYNNKIILKCPFNYNIYDLKKKIKKFTIRLKSYKIGNTKILFII